MYKQAKPMATNKKAAFKEALGPKRTRTLIEHGQVEVPKRGIYKIDIFI